MGAFATSEGKEPIRCSRSSSMYNNDAVAPVHATVRLEMIYDSQKLRGTEYRPARG